MRHHSHLTTPIKILIPGVGEVSSSDLYLRAEVDALCNDLVKKIDELKASLTRAQITKKAFEKKLDNMSREAARWKDECTALRRENSTLIKEITDPRAVSRKLWYTRAAFATMARTTGNWIAYRHDHQGTTISGYLEWKSRWDKALSICLARLKG